MMNLKNSLRNKLIAFCMFIWQEFWIYLKLNLVEQKRTRLQVKFYLTLIIVSKHLSLFNKNHNNVFLNLL
jgi:hypothetical protein